MHVYVRTAVLMFTLGLAPAAPTAGKGGSSSSAATSSAASSAAGSSGAMGAKSASGGASLSAGGGSTNRTGGGMYGSYRSAPDLDPKRRISVQDCTKPIVLDGGNLRCK
jgi:hypothetical protein